MRLQAFVIANSRNNYKSCKNLFHKASSVASPPSGDVCKKVCKQKPIHGYPRVLSKKQINDIFVNHWIYSFGNNMNYILLYSLRKRLFKLFFGQNKVFYLLFLHGASVPWNNTNQAENINNSCSMPHVVEYGMCARLAYLYQ